MGSRWVRLRGVGSRVRGTGVGPMLVGPRGWVPEVRFQGGWAPGGGPGGGREGMGQRGRPMAFVAGGGRRWALGERGAGVVPRLLEAPRLVGPRVGWWGPVGWAPGGVEGGTGEASRE